MKKVVLVVLANKPFLNYAKQLFSAAYWKAGWKGDYLLLAHEVDEKDAEWFANKGIIVKHCKALTHVSNKKIGLITATKYYLFTDYFKQWDHVIYLDLDIIIRGPIDGLLDVDGFGACHSLGQTVKDNLLDFSKIEEKLLVDIKSKFNLKANAFNSGVISFSANIIKDNMRNEIIAFYDKYINAALFTDQTISNLYFNDWIELPIVYNRTIEKSEYSRINPDTFEGIMIHTVSLGDGPWNPDNVFHEEWLENFEKADLIDLSNVPNVEPWPEKKIQQQSGAIINKHIFGKEQNVFYFIKKTLKLFFTNPARAVVKARQFLEMLLKKTK